jgi:hypothetical protein
MAPFSYGFTFVLVTYPVEMWKEGRLFSVPNIMAPHESHYHRLYLPLVYANLEVSG